MQNVYKDRGATLERMGEYRLCVVRRADGQYLVNYYRKVPDVNVRLPEGVKNFMSRLETAILKEEPRYIAVPENERRTFESWRMQLLSRRCGER